MIVHKGESIEDMLMEQTWQIYGLWQLFVVVLSSLIIKVTLDRIPKSLKLSDSWTCLLPVYLHVLPF